MLRHASGRVRQATQQEEQQVDLHIDPSFAHPIVWAVILVELGFLIITILCTTGDMDPDDGDEGYLRGLARAKQLLKVPELQAYITLASIPFLRTLNFVVLLADASEHFALRENASMLMLFLGHFFRAQAESPSNHVGSLTPMGAKIVLFLIDIILCYLSSYVRKRINTELSVVEKEDFMYR